MYHGNWYDGGETQPANLQEYTPEARPHHANSTANKRQAIGPAPELVSAAGEPIVYHFGEPSSLILNVASQATFWKPGAILFDLLPGSRLNSF